MEPKLIAKITIDFLMMISLLALMAYELIGAAAHEWIGAIMFVLVIAHNMLNWKWWRNLLKGKYTTIRTVRTCIIFLVFVGMIIQMVSGIMMSRYVFAFLPINGGMSFARTMHLIGAYWCFALMSVHLGFHGSMLMGIARKVAHTKGQSRTRTLASRITALSISVYGFYAFVQRDLGSYMILKNQFVFFDFEEPLILFYIDYIAILALFVCVGHYTLQMITHIPEKLKPIKSDNL